MDFLFEWINGHPRGGLFSVWQGVGDRDGLWYTGIVEPVNVVIT